MIAFVVPAHGRFELTEICLRQHADAVAQIEGAVVVVAEDQNLLTAERLGLHTLCRENDPMNVGWRINEGIEFASRELGADWIGVMDSDCWFTPGRALAMARLADQTGVANSMRLTVFREDGRHRLNIHQEMHPFLLLASRLALATVGYRPVREHEQYGWNTSMYESLLPFYRGQITPTHTHELVAFTSPDNLTAYEEWMDQYGGLVSTSTYYGSRFKDLRSAYPSELVDRIEDFYDRH